MVKKPLMVCSKTETVSYTALTNHRFKLTLSALLHHAYALIGQFWWCGRLSQSESKRFFLQSTSVFPHAINTHTHTHTHTHTPYKHNKFALHFTSTPWSYLVLYACIHTAKTKYWCNNNLQSIILEKVSISHHFHFLRIVRLDSVS